MRYIGIMNNAAQKIDSKMVYTSYSDEYGTVWRLRAYDIERDEQFELSRIEILDNGQWCPASDVFDLFELWEIADMLYDMAWPKNGYQWRCQCGHVLSTIGDNGLHRHFAKPIPCLAEIPWRTVMSIRCKCGKWNPLDRANWRHVNVG